MESNLSLNPNAKTKIKSNGKSNILMNIGTCLLLVIVTAFIIYGYKIGLFSSQAAFQNFVAKFGVMAVIVFILIQAVSVIVPFLPTSVGVVAGVLIFHPWVGLMYNYLGICLGSIIAFMLSRRYGSAFVKKIIGEKTYNKFIGWTQQGKKFTKMFAAAIVAPAAPDDVLCYLAGTTQMKYREYIPIILLGKIPSLLVYSVGITAIMHLILSIFK